MYAQTHTHTHKHTNTQTHTHTDTQAQCTLTLNGAERVMSGAPETKVHLRVRSLVCTTAYLFECGARMWVFVVLLCDLISEWGHECAWPCLRVGICTVNG